ncbi:MAG: gamma carbonic anhydrase family protein [Spirochaetes bacterium]|nr:MAG: gamma carbonic anhydrase family protein [Spirochaetota bacterium]
MPVCSFKNKIPVIGKGTWIAPNAYVIGDVRIGRDCFIGFGATIRADFGTIIIGNASAVEEGVVIHGPGLTEIGNSVILGHLAMVHASIVRDFALIGMQALITDNSLVEEWAIVAEKSHVRKKQVIPSGTIFGGIPAEEVGKVTQRHRDLLALGQQAYKDLAAQYTETYREIEWIPSP